MPSTIAPWITTTSFVRFSAVGVVVLVPLGVAVVAVLVVEAVPLVLGVVAVPDDEPLVLVLLPVVPGSLRPLGVVAPPSGVVALPPDAGVPLVLVPDALVPLALGVADPAADGVLLVDAAVCSWFAYVYLPSLPAIGNCGCVSASRTGPYDGRPSSRLIVPSPFVSADLSGQVAALPSVLPWMCCMCSWPFTSPLAFSSTVRPLLDWTSVALPLTPELFNAFRSTWNSCA